MVKVGEISPPTFRISAMQVWRKLAGLHFVEEINHESHCSRLLFSTICLAYTSAFAQGDFSADVVNGRNPDHKTKIYVTQNQDAIRRFKQGRNDGRNHHKYGDASLGHSHAGSAYVHGNQRCGSYAMSHNMFKFFRPTDAEDGCTHWTKLKRPSDPDWDCRKIGDETVNGRSTVKYEGTSKKSETHYVWIDKKIVFPIKWQSNGESGESSGELQNIQEGPQAASLFEIPSDYQKMDMSQMMTGHSPKQ
jgi:hypothetical protein